MASVSGRWRDGTYAGCCAWWRADYVLEQNDDPNHMTVRIIMMMTVMLMMMMMMMMITRASEREASDCQWSRAAALFRVYRIKSKSGAAGDGAK